MKIGVFLPNWIGDAVMAMPALRAIRRTFHNAEVVAVLRPYVDLLLQKGDAASAAEIFSATQLMVRPGLAQTQAVLARELNGGTDEAARLFRQSVTLTRNIERARVELARLEDSPTTAPEELIKAASLRRTVSMHALGNESIIGIPTQVVADTLIGFLVFGVMLAKTGGGEFFMNFASAMMGTTRGGPAKVAVVSSGFFGMLSGSPTLKVRSAVRGSKASSRETRA